jgi:hypothetical protein
VHDEGRSSFGLILNALKYLSFLSVLIDNLLTFDYVEPVLDCWVMTGLTTPIYQSSVAIREKIISAWDISRLAPFRAIYWALTAIVKWSWLLSSPIINSMLSFPRVSIYGKPTKGFRHEFLHLPLSNKLDNLLETIITNVVVISSGYGRAVIAKNLAEARYRVLIVEKSYSYTSGTFLMLLNKGFVNIFEGGGTILSDNRSTAILVGLT